MNKNALIITICILAVLGAFGLSLSSGDDPISPMVIRVACIGDSITEGYGIGRPKSYPAQLQMLLGDEYQVLNYGLSGRTLQRSGDLPYTEERLYTISMGAQPDIVLIMLGTNDTHPDNWNASRYEEELEEFVRGYQELGSTPTVYLMTPPPIYRMDLSQSHEILVAEVIPIIERVAEKTGVQTIDVFSALTNHGEFFPDGVHPNANGSKIIAETVYSALTK